MKENEIRPAEIFNRYLALSREDIEKFFSDRRNFVEVNCPACGSANQQPGLEKFDFVYVLCGECATLYVSPRPEPSQLDNYYRDAQAIKFWSTHFYKQTVDARREKMFRPRAKLVAEILDQYTHREPSIFVDVGCGYGVFLDEVRRLKLFKQLIGIEPNADLADVSAQRGFSIIRKVIEDVSKGEVQADFATAFEVLEHVFDPLKFLRAIRQILKPGGIVLFTTLTVSGFDIQLLWEQSKSVYPPHHINLISVEGMQRLVERAGFQIIDLATPGELDVDIVSNMIKEDPSLRLPRFVSGLLRDERSKREFQDFLRRNKLSSHIRVIAAAGDWA